jgi:hypothetical protein
MGKRPIVPRGPIKSRPHGVTTHGPPTSRLMPTMARFWLSFPDVDRGRRFRPMDIPEEHTKRRGWSMATLVTLSSGRRSASALGRPSARSATATKGHQSEPERSSGVRSLASSAGLSVQPMAGHIRLRVAGGFFGHPGLRRMRKAIFVLIPKPRRVTQDNRSRRGLPRPANSRGRRDGSAFLGDARSPLEPLGRSGRQEP